MTKQEELLFAIELHNQYELYAQEEEWDTNELCKAQPFDKLPLANQKVMLSMSKWILGIIESEKKLERQRLKEEIEEKIVFILQGYELYNDQHRKRIDLIVNTLREVLALLEEKK